METVKAAQGRSRLTVVPVQEPKGPVLAAGLAFFRFARAEGLRPRLIRRFPLCGLNGQEARDLLGSDSVERTVHREAAWPFRIREEGERRNGEEAAGDGGELSRAEIPVIRRAKPFFECSSCGQYVLGFCRGGFFTSC